MLLRSAWCGGEKTLFEVGETWFEVTADKVEAAILDGQRIGHYKKEV
jgi:hypothetical protein